MIPAFECWRDPVTKKYRCHLRSGTTTHEIGNGHHQQADMMAAIEKVRATNAETPIRFLKELPA